MDANKDVKIRVNPVRSILLSFEDYFNKVFLGFNRKIIERFTKALNKHPSLSPFTKAAQCSEEENLETSKIFASKIIEEPYCREIFDEKKTLVDEVKKGGRLQFELVERMRRETKGLNASAQCFPVDVENCELEYRFGETPNLELIELQSYIRKKVGLDEEHQPENLTLLRNLENEEVSERRSLLTPRISSSLGSETFEK